VTDLKYKFEIQKRELAESLKYASYIQKALLPSEAAIKKIFNDCFVYFKPRDIVSGDFYWISKKSNLIYLAVGDCTGHGVPGAFLSILGLSFLNHIVDNQHFISSNSFLNILREHLMKALSQTGDISEQKDGIDMSLCIIDCNTNKLEFSGAFHSLFIINSDQQLIEINGDKMQIGVAAELELPFTSHSIELKKNDMIYLFSDGFVDQFGGPDGKKFKYANFRKLLLEISNLPTYNQLEKLHKSHLSWKGNISQLDDILILGVRYT
jgi:serine phosphatase RsbU (regulator of sigma subunit)